METKKIKETIEITHKGSAIDVKLLVRIDYARDRVDIVEYTHKSASSTKKKEFIFLNKKPEKLQEWVDISEAIIKVTMYAKQRLGYDE